VARSCLENVEKVIDDLAIHLEITIARFESEFIGFVRISVVRTDHVIANEELAFAQQLLPGSWSVVDLGQSISASTFANKVDRSNTNNGIHSPMPSRNLLWTIELTIGNEAVAIRRKMDIGMAIQTPDIVAAHFGCAGDEFGGGCLPRHEPRLRFRRFLSHRILSLVLTS
jgi:hypothetical protein